MNMQTEEGRNRQQSETATDKVQKAADQAQQKASETASTVKEQAKKVTEQVQEQAKGTLDTRMDEAARELDTVAGALRETSSKLQNQDEQTIARYGNRIADQIDHMASYLDERNVDEIMTDAQDLARRQPVLFLGGAFMLGLVAGRFLRSSSRQMSYEGSSYGQGMGSQQSGAYGRSQAGRPMYRTVSQGMQQQSTTTQDRNQEGPSVFRTASTEEYGENPTAYPTGRAEASRDED